MSILSLPSTALYRFWALVCPRVLWGGGAFPDLEEQHPSTTAPQNKLGWYAMLVVFNLFLTHVP